MWRSQVIIDCHVHIFPEEIRSDRSAFFKGEAEFKLLYDAPGAKLVGVESLIRTMDDEKVDRAVVFGFPWNSGELAKRHNDYIMASVSTYADRLKGLACFDSAWDHGADEAERCINGGLSGVGELAFYLSGIDTAALDRLEPIMAVCKSRGDLPVMIHTNEPVGHSYPGKTSVTLEEIYALAGRFPDNRIILAHWGGGIFFYHLMKREVKAVLKNIWYDTAASPFLYDPAIYQSAFQLGIIDKVLFGSDFPLLKPSRYLSDLAVSKIPDAALDQVLGKNVARLFDW